MPITSIMSGIEEALPGGMQEGRDDAAGVVKKEMGE